MTTLFAERALLPGGWADDVRVEFGTDGVIAAVTPGVAAEPEDERLGGRVLLPAAANLHSHAFQRAMAGLTEFRTAERDSFWTWRTMMYGFVEALTPDDVEAIAAQAYMEMLEAGFAAVAEFHYLHHDHDSRPYADPAEMAARIAAAAGEAGIGLTLLPVLYAHGGAGEQPPLPAQRRFVNNADSYLRLLANSRETLECLPDARIGVAPHSLRAVSPALLRTVLDAAPDGPVHTHIAEQRQEVEDVERWLGSRPVDWLLDNADVDERWCLVHATHMDDGERRRLAESGAVAGLCPVTEANLGDGIFALPEYLDDGGTFGVGSDSNVLIGLAEELRTLEYGQRLRLMTRNTVADSERSTGRVLYDAALRGSAQAAGRRTGALAPGCLADLMTLDRSAIGYPGSIGDRLLDRWIFAGSHRVVADVWAGGRRVVSEGRHCRRAQIRRRYDSTLARLVADL